MLRFSGEQEPVSLLHDGNGRKTNDDHATQQQIRTGMGHGPDRDVGNDA